VHNETAATTGKRTRATKTKSGGKKQKRTCTYSATTGAHIERATRKDQFRKGASVGKRGRNPGGKQSKTLKPKRGGFKKLTPTLEERKDCNPER